MTERKELTRLRAENEKLRDLLKHEQAQTKIQRDAYAEGRMDYSLVIDELAAKLAFWHYKATNKIVTVDQHVAAAVKEVRDRENKRKAKAKADNLCAAANPPEQPKSP